MVYVPFGAYNTDPDDGRQVSNERILTWGNDQSVFVDYFNDDSTGPQIRLIGNGKALPANASVRIYWSLSGGSSASQPSGLDQAAVDARAALQYTDAEKSKLAGLMQGLSPAVLNVASTIDSILITTDREGIISTEQSVNFDTLNRKVVSIRGGTNDLDIEFAKMPTEDFICVLMIDYNIPESGFPRAFGRFLNVVNLDVHPSNLARHGDSWIVFWNAGDTSITLRALYYGQGANAQDALNTQFKETKINLETHLIGYQVPTNYTPTTTGSGANRIRTYTVRSTDHHFVLEKTLTATVSGEDIIYRISINEGCS